MITSAVIALVGLQLDLGRQLKIAQRFGELDAVERLRLVGNQRIGHHRGVAKPSARRRHLTAAAATDVGDKLLDAWHAWLLPVPLEHPDTNAGFGRHSLERFELL